MNPIENKKKSLGLKKKRKVKRKKTRSSTPIT